MSISLICTVRDEADNIGELIASILVQTRLPSEIVINDCGSQDATASIIQRFIVDGYPIRLVSGGHNISSGRNNAIAHAHGSIIVSTDAGLRLDRNWLERIVAPIERDEADVVGGFFEPAPHSLFELTLAATNYRTTNEINRLHFLPFGKSLAFRKAAWQAVGGFPEWLDHCEDLLFDRALVAAGYRITFVPDALVYFRPRSTLSAFMRQYYYYARGDGIAGLWPLRHLIRYTTYTALLAVLIGARRRRWLPVLLVPWLAAYTRGPYRRLRPQIANLPASARLRALALVPLIRLVGDGAKMVGYPVGRWQRRGRRLKIGD